MSGGDSIRWVVWGTSPVSWTESASLSSSCSTGMFCFLEVEGPGHAPGLCATGASVVSRGFLARADLPSVSVPPSLSASRRRCEGLIARSLEHRRKLEDIKRGRVDAFGEWCYSTSVLLIFYMWLTCRVWSRSHRCSCRPQIPIPVLISSQHCR